MRHLAIALLMLASTVLAAEPVAFLAAPRTTGFFRVQSVSEGGGPYVHHVGTSLILLKADGTEQLLVQGDKPGFRAVHDHCWSLDRKSIIYSHIRTTSPLTCDLFRIVLATGEVTQLTNAATEFLPPTGYFPITEKRGVWNSSPCDTPSGIVFVSNRSAVMSPAENYVAMQLFRMEQDGKDVEKLGHMNLGGAAHPTLGPNGRIYFATGEQQGWRTGRGGGWGIWSINPDGTDWQPEISAIPAKGSFAWHFQTITSDGSLVTEAYYDTRAYGQIHVAPRFEATPFGPPSPFGDPVLTKNPILWDARKSNETRLRGSLRFSFQRRGMYSLFPWATIADTLNKDFDGSFLGMVAHPDAIPGNGVLLTWTGDKGDAAMDLGIYSVANVAAHKPDPVNPILPASHPRVLIKVLDLPDRHEWMAKSGAPWQDIYGSLPPKSVGEVATELPIGSAYGVIGSSSVNWREIVTADGKALVTFPNDAVKWLRVMAFNPTQDLKIAKPVSNVFLNAAAHPRSEGFSSVINERTGYYETLVPLESDGSFKCIIPADHPWSVQLLNAKGEALTTAQTWHQIRPREKRVNCNGCHAHYKPTPFSFTDSIAGQPGYVAAKLDKIASVEYERDLKGFATEGPRPWAIPLPGTTKDDPKRKAYASLLNDVDDNPLFTDAQARLYRTWQDTGYMAAGQFPDGTQITPDHGTGPYADTVPPALSIVAFKDRIIVGAADAQSGLNKASLKSVPALAWTEADGIWTAMGAPPASLTVEIRDNQRAKNSAGAVVSQEGNVTRLAKTFGELPEFPKPPNPNQAEIDALLLEADGLRARLAEIESRLLELDGIDGASAAERAALLSELQGLEN